MTSMEEFGPVSVDYFHGRTVEAVEEGQEDSSGETPVWTLRFEGGGKLHNYDPTYPAPPPNIVGLVLTLTTLGGHLPSTERGQGAPQTVLYFGDNLAPRKMQVNLNPMQYAISDDTYTQGQTVFAQRSRWNMPGTVPGHPEMGSEAPADDGA